MRYNKVRGIVRAKQGSQIPKFQEPAGPLNQVERLKLAQMYGYHEDPNPLNTRPDYGLNRNPNPHITGSNTPSLKQEMPDMLKLDIPETKTTFSNVLGAVGRQTVRNIGNFAKNNPNLVGVGLDYASNKIGSSVDINSKGFNAVSKGLSTAGDVLMAIPGGQAFGLGAKVLNLGLNTINSLTKRNLRNWDIESGIKTRQGGSYGGSMSLFDKIKSFEGQSVGGFTGTGKYDKMFNEGDRQKNIITNIDNTYQDQVAMAGNNLNYIGYQMQQDGGYDQRYAPRFTKQGGTLIQKIDLVKSRKFNQVINVDTKQVEEFKDGGKLEVSEWEPVIESFEEWEPEIILEVEEFKDGGKTKEELETPEIEETNQKNLIPEGALHKNKHHMEHTEGLTQKGIPVIDNDGEQQAEIELNEIIFTLEVTKKLEELYKDGSDEAAIEAGRLLVKEILFNTDDRTGLISKCEEGGKL